MHFSLVTSSGAINSGFRCFDDVIVPLYHALVNLGFRAEIRYESTRPDSTNIVFGLNNPDFASKLHLPEGSIIFNLEQYTEGSRWFTKEYSQLLGAFSVWDYSLRNCQLLQKELSISPEHVRLGFVDEMVQIPANDWPTSGLLFYGSLNQRRRDILKQLRQKKVDLRVENGIFGARRDFQIFASKMVLNLHYYEPAILELPRLGYLFANRKPVVSELQETTEIYPDHEETCFFFPREEIAERVPALLANSRACKAKAEAAFKIFSGTRQEDILKPIVGQRAHAVPGAKPMPGWLNLGSGKDFLRHAVNIDIEEHCNPDIVHDLSQSAMDGPLTFQTMRFGDISLKEGCFSRIIAHDVLEHVPNLRTLMGNLLYLLEEGGELEINVPYELSTGAWQDPTHVRTFNENSWRYYCQWAWYMGWREYRFDQVFLAYTPSAYGTALSQEKNFSSEVLLRTPRALDSLFTILRKRQSLPHEKAEYDFWFKRSAKEFRDGSGKGCAPA